MSHIERFLSGVAWRLGAERLLRGLVLWLCAAAAAGGGLVLGERLVSLGAPVALLAALPLFAAALAGLALGLSRWPGRRVSALEADARFHLEERVSSALDAGEGPMADLVRADAERRTQAIDLRRDLPVRLPRSARALAVLLPALAIALFVPPLDVFEWAKRRAERTAEAKAVRGAASAAVSDLEAVRRAAGGRGPGEAGQVAQKLQELVAPLAQPNATPADARAAAKKAESELDAAEKANREKQRLAAGDPEQVRRTEANEDALAQLRRALDRFAKALPGHAPATAAGGAREKETGPTPPPSPVKWVKASERAETGAPVGPPEPALIAAERPRAEQAMAHEPPAWPYRAVVQRYFSPEE